MPNIKRNKKFDMNILIAWLMIIPGLVYLLFNNFLPMYGITIAFKSPDFSLPNVLFSPYNGFENFRFIFESETIWLYVRNTVLYNLVFIALNLIIPVTLAILFTQIKNGLLKTLYQTSILLPYLMSWVVVSYVTTGLFSGENGLINSILMRAGKEKIDFYGEDSIGYWPFILTIFNVWKTAGFTFLFYYSSIIAINPELLEAARLDGASFTKRVFHIILPSIKGIAITMIILAISKIFYSDYGLFYMLTNNSGPLYDVTQTIDTFVFNSLKGNGDIVSSSAASVLQSLVGFVLVVIANTILRKVDRDNSLF